MTYGEFKRELLDEIAHCLNMPFNVPAGNSSGYNYASGRRDHQTYFKSIYVEQDHLGGVDPELRVRDRSLPGYSDNTKATRSSISCSVHGPPRPRCSPCRPLANRSFMVV